MIKGVQNVRDAAKLADLGVDGILLSNHGGRQLDRAPIPFHLLPDVVRELCGEGDTVEIGVDTGIMSGADIVASIALGRRTSRWSGGPTSTASWPAGARASTAPSRSCGSRSCAP